MSEGDTRPDFSNIGKRIFSDIGLDFVRKTDRLYHIFLWVKDYHAFQYYIDIFSTLFRIKACCFPGVILHVNTF